MSTKCICRKEGACRKDGNYTVCPKFFFFFIFTNYTPMSPLLLAETPTRPASPHQTRRTCPQGRVLHLWQLSSHASHAEHRKHTQKGVFSTEGHVFDVRLLLPPLTCQTGKTRPQGRVFCVWRLLHPAPTTKQRLPHHPSQ